ncbi:CPBP family intramembrane glutamic endopeptidase [Gemmata massiliana]|nr:type II CAAX endopeptidase family protein [Gemmata massiliana]
MALSQVAAIIVGVCIVVWFLATGGNAQRLATDLPALLVSTPVFITLLLASQGGLFVTTLAAARLAPVPLRGGLGFVHPGLPVWGYLVLVLGSFFPLIAGVAVFEAASQVMPMDQSLGSAFEQVTPGGGMGLVLFMALVPGFVEEAFFRGYIQRRLLARWPAWAAIIVTAGLFGLMHFYPANIAFAFVMGLWLGVVAWRTGSVWPAALCHAAVNATSGVGNLGARFGIIPDPIPDVAVGGVITLALACFLASMWLLKRGLQTQMGDSGVAEEVTC